MTFLEIATFYVVAAVVFYGHLMATAVDETAIGRFGYRRARRTRSFHQARALLNGWRPGPRLIPIRASSARRARGR